MCFTKNWYQKGETLLADIIYSNAGPNEALLWFLGQAGFVIKSAGVTLAIDMILHDYGAGSAHKRLSPVPFPPDSSLPVDYALCTHDHSDHLNLETLLPQARGNPATQFIVPLPCAPLLVAGGIARERIIGARAGCPVPAGDTLTITPVAAAHSEYKTDENGDDWYLGYIISGGGVTIYHAGDGIVTERLVATLKKYRPIHIAILPVNGMDWERTAQGIIGNMNCEDAVKLARAIDADLTIPSHFDFLSGNTINPARFTDVFYSLCAEKKHHIPALGERVIYRA